LKYRSGYKYQLAESISFQTNFKSKTGFKLDFISITKEGLITGSKGYAWDGPSGPTYDDDLFMLLSLLHDMLYQLIRAGFFRHDYWRLADHEMESLLKVILPSLKWAKRTFWKARIKWIMWGLDKANGRAALTKNKKVVHSVYEGRHWSAPGVFSWKGK